MKSILKWFAILMVIIFCALLLYQNNGVLLEKKTFYLLSQDLFGFNFGTVELPLLIYFIFCVLAGALFMAIPSVGLWFSVRRLRKRLRRTDEDEEEDTRPQPVSGDDLAYHIKEDEGYR